MHQSLRRRASRDKAARTPWAVAAAAAGRLPMLARMFPRGGKMDDVTAVVAIISAAP